MLPLQSGDARLIDLGADERQIFELLRTGQLGGDPGAGDRGPIHFQAVQIGQGRE